MHFADRGWHVFPITPGAKKPPVIDRWETRASTDPDQIHHWWHHTPYTIGIATGPSRLVVVDLDTRKHGQPAPDRWTTLGISTGTGVLRVLARQTPHHRHPDLRRHHPLRRMAPLLHRPGRGGAAQHP